MEKSCRRFSTSLLTPSRSHSRENCTYLISAVREEWGRGARICLRVQQEIYERESECNLRPEAPACLFHFASFSFRLGSEFHWVNAYFSALSTGYNAIVIMQEVLARNGVTRLSSLQSRGDRHRSPAKFHGTPGHVDIFRTKIRISESAIFGNSKPEIFTRYGLPPCMHQCCLSHGSSVRTAAKFG